MNKSELDIEKPGALRQYLRATGRIARDEQVEVRVLPGGVSNRTVLVRRTDGTAWVIKQALEKLRVKADWFCDPQRVHREAAGLKWLQSVVPAGAVPGFVFEDTEHHLLAMEAVADPHENWKTMLLRGQIDLDIVVQFGALLGVIHRRGWEQREHTSRLFDDRSFFESLRVEPYYLYAAQQQPQAKPFIDKLVEQTRATRLTVVHGDYSPKNILVRDSQIVLLDHEVIHFGDPAFDVGFAMTHFLSKGHHLPAHRASFERAADTFWREYRTQLGDAPWSDEPETRAASHTLACLLARVVGRSLLEYLTDDERQRQTEVVIAMMNESRQSVPSLITEFLKRF